MTPPRSETGVDLTALADDEFLDELQENLALDAFDAFLSDDVVERTRSALIDLKHRTAALVTLTDDPEVARRRNRFVRLVDSRLVRANAALKDANRRRGNDESVVKYANLAERLGVELGKSDRAYALDYIELADGLTARAWIDIRRGNDD